MEFEMRGGRPFKKRSYLPHLSWNDYRFNREECIRLIIAAMGDQGMDSFKRRLEDETGLHAVAPCYVEMKQAIKGSDWPKAFQLLPSLRFTTAKGKAESYRLVAHQVVAFYKSQNKPEKAVDFIRTSMAPIYPSVAQKLAWLLFEDDGPVADPLHTLDVIASLCTTDIYVDSGRLKYLVELAKRCEEATVPAEERVIRGRNSDISIILVFILKELGFLSLAEEISSAQNLVLRNKLADRLDQCIEEGQWEDALEIVNDPKVVGTSSQALFESAERQKQARVLLLEHALDDLIVDRQAEAVKLARVYSVNKEKSGEILFSEGGKLHKQQLTSELGSMLSTRAVVSDSLVAYIFALSLKHQAAMALYWCDTYESLQKASILRDIESNRDDVPSHCVQSIGHDDEVWELGFSPDGNFLAVGTKSGNVYVYESTTNGMELHSLYRECHEDGINCLDWSRDSAKILTGSRDGYAAIIDVTKKSFVRSVMCANGCDLTDIASVCWLPDGSGFFTGSYEGRLCRWSEDGSEKWTFEEGIRVLSMGISACGKKLAVLSVQLKKEEKMVHLLDTFDIEESKFMDEIELYTPLASLAICKESGHYLVNVVPEGLRLWHPDTNEISHHFSGPIQKDLKIRSSFGGPFDKYIVAGSEDCNIRVFNRFRKELVSTLHGHSDVVNTVKWSPNKAMIASASDDRTVRIWKPKHAE